MEDAMALEGPACACATVKYDPVQHEDGTKSERWRCLYCHTEFKKNILIVEKKMKKTETVWQEEIIHNVEAECPYCGGYLYTDSIIKKCTMIGSKIKDLEVICVFCNNTFLLDIFA